MEKRSFNIVIGVTGSVAALKLPILEKSLMELNEKLQDYKFQIHVIATEYSKHFFQTDEIKSKIYDDTCEWETWKKRGDPVMHIELGKMADIMVIAPLDANTLAKLSTGICDNMLTCTVRAWDLKKPLLFCPAMNTRMWEHPITATQIAQLKSWGYEEIPPISKLLMCGDVGVGGMADVGTIVDKIKETADRLYRQKG
ncbi:phosphopantothenoylcysteine decarboxylase [Pieris rapae]|uniref:phosphopantothenoylcysteine decarboxylase n=1 Tax=Pieris rapae TaxID=64459 RepID=UPI000B92CB03|nr:phosphopantothenoylcysteine decarboxylase [Pieris rapae]